MTESATLCLDILPPAPGDLWDELIGVPPSFTLYGGTATLHLGHRQSTDYDLFAFENFDPLRLYHEIPFLHGSEILRAAPIPSPALSIEERPYSYHSLKVHGQGRCLRLPWRLGTA